MVIRIDPPYLNRPTDGTAPGLDKEPRLVENHVSGGVVELGEQTEDEGQGMTDDELEVEESDLDDESGMGNSASSERGYPDDTL